MCVTAVAVRKGDAKNGLVLGKIGRVRKIRVHLFDQGLGKAKIGPCEKGRCVRRRKCKRKQWKGLIHYQEIRTFETGSQRCRKTDWGEAEFLKDAIPRLNRDDRCLARGIGGIATT